jgi:hypothetical protein
LNRTNSHLVLALVLTAGAALPVQGQDAVLPDGLARVELERSRQCVDVLARIEALEQRLEPLAVRSQRLIGIANAIALEDRSSVEPLDPNDATEAAVAAWFERDLELATRYLDENDEAITAQRTEARQAIRERVAQALAALQEAANQEIDTAGDLSSTVGGCDGAILIRSAVIEACATTTSPVCEPARNGGTDSPYRFVDAPADLWQVEELRPWTNPAPLGVTPDGQIGGARTVGYARTGNLTLTVSFGPILGSRENFTPDEISRFQAIVDSAGFTFDHPEVAFAPSMSMRASAPEPLAGETMYILHFGEATEADVIWSGPSGTGEAVEATVPLSPRHLARLGQGHPISFTAVVEDADGEGGEAVYSVMFTPINQSPAASALVGYMSQQLATDLAQIVPVGGR